MDTINKIRKIYRATVDYQNQFEKTHNLGLNEADLLILLSEKGSLTSGKIAELMDLSLSNTSKTLRSVENKRFVYRMLGEKDRRNMYFTLTNEGKKMVKVIKSSDIALPEILEDRAEVDILKRSTPTKRKISQNTKSQTTSS